MGQPDRETAPEQPAGDPPVPAPAPPPAASPAHVLPADASPAHVPPAHASPADADRAAPAAPGLPEPTGPSRPAIRASDRERDAATHRLQDAFAESRLDDSEFDERMRAALTARTRGELATLLADLPEVAPAQAGGQLAPAAGPRPGRLALGIKGPVRRAGRWRVPEHYTAVVYKGSGLLDLRAAELTGPVTTITAVAYKSRIDILVPPGVRVEAGGFAVTTDAEAASPVPLPPDAPVVHVRGFAYKGSVGTLSGPPAS